MPNFIFEKSNLFRTLIAHIYFFNLKYRLFTLKNKNLDYSYFGNKKPRNLDKVEKT